MKSEFVPVSSYPKTINTLGEIGHIVAFTRYARIISIPDADLLRLQKRKCFYCGRKLSKKYTRDHLYPKSQGYTLAGNKVLSHKSCNQKKADRIPTSEEVERFMVIVSKYREGGGIDGSTC